MKLRIALIIGALILGALGVALGMYADQDDAPGGVLMGMLLILGAVMLVVKAIPPRA
jgi:hypothetical protein